MLRLFSKATNSLLTSFTRNKATELFSHLPCFFLFVCFYVIIIIIIIIITIFFLNSNMVKLIKTLKNCVLNIKILIDEIPKHSREI